MLKDFRVGAASAVVVVLALLTSLALSRPMPFDLIAYGQFGAGDQAGDADPDAGHPDEASARSERSANISHILGVSRKIHIIMNRIGLFLQITPDGTVNGTEEDNDYTIFQRAALTNSKIKIQGIATCNFLCMDRCGLLYGSREFTDECIFNEVMEEHFFNTYSSSKYSNDKRTLYLALNKKGVPRKVQTKPNASLDKLETYTNVLTKAVPTERVEALETKIYNARVLFGKLLMGGRDDHALRHRHRYHQICAATSSTPIVAKGDKFRCRKREKRKKKRKCREDEDENDECQQPLGKKKHHKPQAAGKCEEGEEEDECQRRLHMIRKKRKSRNGESNDNADNKKRKKRLRKKYDGGKGKAAADPDYDGDPFTETPDPDEDSPHDYADWTTSAAVHD